MAFIIEPVPTVPNPVPNKVIVAAQRGGYDPYVQDNSGRQVNLVDYVRELLGELDGSGITTARFNVQNGYAGSSVAALADNEWVFDNPPSPTVLQSIVLPSVSDLGIDTEKYQVFAKTVLVVQDALNSAGTAQTRLVNMATGLPIAGSTATKEITTGNTEAVVESDWFECPTNGNFFLDFRSSVSASANVFQGKRQTLLVRITRR